MCQITVDTQSITARELELAVARFSELSDTVTEGNILEEEYLGVFESGSGMVTIVKETNLNALNQGKIDEVKKMGVEVVNCLEELIEVLE